jgi:hypothetical protein
VAQFAVILLLGLIIALLARWAAKRLTARSAQLISRLGHGHGSLPPGSAQIGSAVGGAVFWLVMALTLLVATETLGPPVVTAWLGQLLAYVPRLAVAILIAALGTIVARVARRVVTSTASSANLPAAGRIGKMTEVALLIGVGLVAVEQLGVEVSLLTTLIVVVIASLLGGAALAFGLGSRDWVANMLSAYYVERLYQVGQTIRVRDVEGRIVRITDTAVILESDEGEVALPASEFSRAASTLIVRGRAATGAGR